MVRSRNEAGCVSGSERHYIQDPELRRNPPPEGPPPGKPRPGHGDVYVNQLLDGTWTGSWEDRFPSPDENGSRSGWENIFGAKDEVLRWARSRPAKRFLIWSKEADDYIPLSAEEP